MQMPDRAMTAHTGSAFARFQALRIDRHDRLRDLSMTFLAGLFGDLQIVPFDLYRLVKSAAGEIERMPEAIRRLGRIFADQSRRRVAIVTGGDGAVRGLHPAVILLIHDVTIRARSRIVGEIRISFGVNEGVQPQPHRQAHHYT